MKKYLVVVLLMFVVGCSKIDTPVNSITAQNVNKSSDNEYLINIDSTRGTSVPLSNFTFKPYYPDSIVMTWTAPDTGKAITYYIKVDKGYCDLANFPAPKFDMKYTIITNGRGYMPQFYYYNICYILGSYKNGPQIGVYINRLR